MPSHLLIAEDEPVQRQMLSRLLEKKLGYTVEAVENGKEALLRLKAAPLGMFGAVLLDIQMPEMDGFETLRYLRNHYPTIPVIMLTASGDAETAVKAIKEGASDFLSKPVDIAQLEVTLINALKMRRMADELSRLKRDKEGALHFTDIIGHKGGLQTAVAIGRKAAASDVPIFLTGETGVGKELFARAIHGESRRAGAPFIAINCGAIPANLIESILFGHEKGAFTSATSRSIGKFREAEGGTIFLDEIGDLPLEAQVKLLRVLQQKEVEPVGAARPVKVDVRVISATHHDLKSDVQQGQFREDLYFRLNVLPLVIPPLRQRTEDIVPMAEAFLERFALADGLHGKPLSADAAVYLRTQHWPGNVRELENLMRRALVLSDDTMIEARLLQQLHAVEESAGGASLTHSQPLHINLLNDTGRFKTITQIEAEAMHKSLHYHGNNITHAAEALDMAKSTFYRKMKEQSENHS